MTRASGLWCVYMPPSDVRDLVRLLSPHQALRVSFPDQNPDVVEDVVVGMAHLDMIRSLDVSILSLMHAKLSEDPRVVIQVLVRARNQVLDCANLLIGTPEELEDLLRRSSVALVMAS